MKATLITLIILTTIILTGCTDAEWESWAAYGDEHKVTLYSGGQAVREWTATGQVSNEGQSDGYFFKDKSTGKLVRVTGDVVIERLD